MNRRIALLTLAVFAVGVLIMFMNRGYERISEQGYKYSLALISACNRQDEIRVRLIATEVSESQLPEYDRSVIVGIADTALSGDWQQAARRARALLKAQVRESET